MTDTPQDIKDKIDRLNEQAWQTRISDSPGSFKLSEEALKYSNKVDYPKGRANALKCYGFALVRLSKNNEALPYLNEANTIFQAIKDMEGQAVVTEYLGIIQRNWGNFLKSLELLKKSLQLSQQIGLLEVESTTFYQLGVTYKYLGNYEQALDCYHKCLQISRSTNHALMEGYALNVIGAIYFEIENYSEALHYYQQALPIRQASGDKWGEAGSLDNIGAVYIKLEQWQQAEEHCCRSLSISESTNDKRGQANALFHLAQIYQHKGIAEKTHVYLENSLEIRRNMGDRKGEAELLIFRSDLLRAEKNPERDIQTELRAALLISEEINAAELSGKAHWNLYESEKRLLNYSEALMHLEKYQLIEKQLHKDAVGQKVINLQISQRAEQSEKDALRLTVKNEELATLNGDLKRQQQETAKAYDQLKSTQAQLIQSEKMASLGELTAGIAHEIQNPLNFVNNFSEINREMLEELKAERLKPKAERDESLEADILNDVIDNEQKINHHGKRADAIVKGMLQHSRASTGEKELTDINALAQEYLRLSYQGFRAKGKDFSATIITHFDESIGKIELVPQDIGRVLLNLYNNAFYAVGEKRKAEGVGYEPKVLVTTKREGNKVEIRVKDNGNGIPQRVIDKIFQPFFTTKPTGQGTGLGLSLSYDIIKAHGGELKVKAMEGEGSEFVIELPV